MNRLGSTSEKLLCKVERISKVKVSVVEQVTDSDIQLLSAVLRKLWQELAQVLSLTVCQDFIPGAFTHHGEKNVRLLQRKIKRFIAWGHWLRVE